MAAIRTSQVARSRPGPHPPIDKLPNSRSTSNANSTGSSGRAR